MQYDALCFVAIRFDAITTIEKYTAGADPENFSRGGGPIHKNKK